MALYRSKVKFKHSGHRRVGWTTPEFYGAAGTGLVNDRTAIFDAIQDLQEADGGGEIVLRPGGRYRLDGSTLTLPGNISLRALKGAGLTAPTLIRNHAFPLLSITNDLVGYNETPTLIEGVTFTDAMGGGAMVVAAEGSVDLVRCALLGVAGITDSSLPLVYVSADLGATCRLSRCHLMPVNGQNAVRVLNGSFIADGGTVFKLPATYTGEVVRVVSNDANIPAHVVLCGGTDFDASLHTSGSATFVYANGDHWAVSANGCLFRGGSATSNGFVWTNAGISKLNVGHNTWKVTNRYLPEVVDVYYPLSFDSDLELRPYLVHAAPGTTYTLPTGVRSVAVRFQSTSPTITMPPALFAGQEMKVSVLNMSISNWVDGFSVSGLVYDSTGPVNSATGRSFIAHVVDRNIDGALEWVIASGWTTFPG